ncbi:MAG: lamin tail domain-containing protein [Verrucomicrobiota bacterium]
MHDDGTEGDQVAGDGLWSATIPGQPLNALVAFQVAATDAAAQPATSTFPVAAPARECLVRFGEPQPGGTFGTYRIWMTQATRTRWSTREKLNNAPLDVTFVYGNQRVIYNAGSLYTGSPFVSPGYTGPTTAPLCGYAVHFPSDDLFLGADEMKLDWPVRDNTLQMEQVAYWIAGQMGLPSNHRRFVFLYVNGVKRGNVYEDSQQPNSDMVAQYFPDDSDGDLYKIDDWFEFDNAAANFGNQNVDASLDDFTTTGGEKKTARYRWNFRKRAVKQSASDYRSLFALVDATRFNSADAAQRVEAVMDLDKYLGIVAMEHVVGNWDSFGYSRGKNMQTYKPQRGKWHLLAWDIDFVLNAESDPSDAYLFATRDQTIAQMMFYPPSQRAYLRALATAAEGPLTPARFSPVLAGNYAALLANGITPSFYGGSSNYMTRRATYIKQQLADYNTAFALSSNVTTIATPDSTLLLQGTAPVQVREIQVDGVAYPIVWADATHWQMAVPLQSRSSQLQIAALDGRGRPLGQTKTLQVNSSASFQDPAGQIVFNEIMYRPSVPLGDYIEFYNRSATEGFDLSGWQVQGVNYTFPAGSLLPPSSFLVLARDPAAFWQAYGPDAVPAGYFQVDLNRDRATLRLLRPGGTPSTNRTVAEVSYSSTLPWPAEASEGGISLQLRDPNQAQDRVGNWSAKRPGAPAEWDLVSVTAPAGSSKLLVYLSSLPPVRDVTSIAGVWDLGINFGGGSSPYRTEFRTNATGGWEGDFIFLGQGQEQRSSLATVGITNDILVFGFSEQQPEFRFTLGTNPLQMTGQFQQPDRSYASTLKRYNPGGDAYIDDLWLNNGAEPRGGVNLLANGDFESTLSASWSLGTNLTRSRIESGLSKSGDSSLHLIATTGGFDERTALWQEVSAVQPGQLYTLSFWLRRGTNAAGLVARMADWSLATARDLRPVKNKPISFTPGEPNSTLTQLTELPRLWLNELAPVNINGPADRQGQRSPWLELYNAGTNPIPLGDFLLGDSQAAANPWAFPANAAIAPGAYHLVWLDGNPSQSTESEWHAGFRPDPSQGVVVLWRREGQELRVVDFVDYTSLPTGHSIGWASDGVPTERWTFAQPTPAQPNTTTATVAVFINEWMAANDRTWSDPADDDFEDWFELYNAGTARADLSGYLLSDTVADPRKFVVPPGTTIAPHGYLLVWADGEPGQNRPGDDLHVNFKLSASGESILLSNPSGAQVDLVTFGPQPQEEAEGRWPDGAAGSFRLLTEPTPGEANVWNEDLRLAAIRQTASGKIETYWPSIAGQQFRVQSKDDLNAAAWVDIDQPITAVGPETSITISSPPTGQRFFRVLILQP